MGLFSFFSRNKSTEQIDAHNESDLELFAPVGGTLLSLREVPDLVISEKLIGDGVAIAPERSTNMIYAPCDGTITRITASNNAFSINVPPSNFFRHQCPLSRELINERHFPSYFSRFLLFAQLHFPVHQISIHREPEGAFWLLNRLF